MKIVILDGYCLNPGDLSWDAWRELGQLEVYDRTPPDKTIQRASGAQAAVTNKTVLDRAVIEALDELRYIGVLATGYDVVDTAAAAERGVPVTNVPTYGTDSVVEHTFALILEHYRNVGYHSRLVRESEWARSPDFSFWRTPLTELYGKTMGVVGLGRIGRRVAQVALAFGMKVLAADVRREEPLPGDFQWAEMDQVFPEADIVSLHCPLMPGTRHLVNRERLEAMKPTALLINTSRGGLIVEQDLADALNEGRIAGAAVDVLSSEPPRPDNPLLTARNCFVTPHFAWATREARVRLMNIAVDNLRAFLAGSPRNVVNGV